MLCNCPTSFRYHADNCPVRPSAVLNVRLDKKSKEEEEEINLLRRSLARRAPVPPKDAPEK